MICRLIVKNEGCNIHIYSNDPPMILQQEMNGRTPNLNMSENGGGETSYCSMLFFSWGKKIPKNTLICPIVAELTIA